MARIPTAKWLSVMPLFASYQNMNHPLGLAMMCLSVHVRPSVYQTKDSPFDNCAYSALCLSKD